LPALIDALAAELERPRELAPRVLNYITGTYELDPANVGAFLENQLPQLEEDEVDLVLSPVFTPKLADQAVFAELLGAAPIPREQWPELVRELAARPTRATLVTPDGTRHIVPLREVTIERYLHRLRLEAAIPDSVFALLEKVPAQTDRPVVRAIARRGAWETSGSREILEQYLKAIIGNRTYELSDLLQLMDLVETRRPKDVSTLLASIPGWTEALREQIEKGSAPKPFFHQQVEMMHGLARDQRGPDEAKVSAKERELAFLLKLQQILQ